MYFVLQKGSIGSQTMMNNEEMYTLVLSMGLYVVVHLLQLLKQNIFEDGGGQLSEVNVHSYEKDIILLIKPQVFPEENSQHFPSNYTYTIWWVAELWIMEQYYGNNSSRFDIESYTLGKNKSNR